MRRFKNCIHVYIILVLIIVKVFCNDADFESPAKSREKRQGRNRGRAQPLGLNLGALDSVLVNLGGSSGSLLGLGGQPDSRPVYQSGVQPQGSEFSEARPPRPPPGGDKIPPGHQERPGNQPGNRPPGRPDQRPGPPPGRPGEHPRPPPGRPGEHPAPPPGRPGERPHPPPGRPEERPGQQNLRPGASQSFHNSRPGIENGEFENSRPGNSQSYQSSRPASGNDGFENSRPGDSQSYQNSRPGSGNNGFENSRPGDSQSFQNSRPGIDDNDEFEYSRPVERPGQQNSRPGNSQSHQNSRPGSASDEFEDSRPVERPVLQDSRPGDSQSFQNSRPGSGNDGFGNSRPVERPAYQNSRPGVSQSFQSNGRPGGEVNNGFGNSRPGEGNNGHQNSRPNNGQQGQQNHGGSGQQLNSPNVIGDESDRYNGVTTESRPQPNRGEGNKKCRGNQYTCRNRECVQRNARCNGINECQDGSDEINCNPTGNFGQDSVGEYTTAAPYGQTTASPTDGCIIPNQPTGGKFELDSCKGSCKVVSGTRVPVGNFLTYKCNEGYSLKGNNVSFCHVNSWYLPPTCVKTCPPLKSNSVDIVCKYQGEIVSCESNSISAGTTATLACKHSYKIPLADDPAYRELTCLEDGVWDRTLFRCLPECGTAVAHGNTLIVNGFTAKLGVFPWHVGIYQKHSASSFVQICAGSLISPDLVISAAHCFYDDTVNEVMDPSEYRVAAGKHYRNYDMQEKYVQKSSVKTIDVAKRYYGASGNFAEDIALVRLTKPFTLTTLVRPICMDWDNRHEREQLQRGKIGKAVGWGKNEYGVPSEELQEINLPFIPYEECVTAVPEEFRGYVTADKFCAGYLNGSSLCEGDSGGGLGFQLDSLWYLRGVVSVSPVSHNSCDNNYYTAFTNVARFRDWIRAAYVTS